MTPSNPGRASTGVSLLRLVLVMLAVFVAASLGAVVVVGLAFIVGKVLVHLLPFTIFEATLLALLGFVVFATAVARTLESILSVSGSDTAEPAIDDEEPPEVIRTVVAVSDVDHPRSPPPRVEIDGRSSRSRRRR